MRKIFLSLHWDKLNHLNENDMPIDVNFDYSQFVMAEYLVPSITVYNRLEAIPRAADFDRSLKA